MDNWGFTVVSVFINQSVQQWNLVFTMSIKQQYRLTLYNRHHVVNFTTQKDIHIHTQQTRAHTEKVESLDEIYTITILSILLTSHMFGSTIYLQR